MTPLRQRLLASVVDARPDERATIVLMFVYSFLAMTSYNIIKPATRASFIVDLGAENLPFVMLAAGLLMGGLMHLYSRIATMIPSRWVIPGTQGIIIAISVVFWLLLRTGQLWVSAAFFFWGLFLGIFLISQFWTLANDLFDARQAKRLFGFIGGGASLGGMTGAATTALTAERFGTDNLVLVSAAPLVVCFVVAAHLSSRRPVDGQPAAGGGRFRGREALGMLRQTKHLRLIAGVIGFAAMSAVTLDQQLSMAAEEHVVEEDAITSFLAQVTVYISLIGFFIQVGLTSRVHRHLGIGFALMVLPVSLGASAVVMLLFPVLWAPALARVLNSSLRYTLDKTSREILFLPLSPELKHSAKPFVDVAVDRFMGKGLGSVVLLVLLKLFDLTWYQLSYLSLVLMVLWIALARRAKREYLMVFRQHLHASQFAPAQMDVPQADLTTIGLLVEELGHPDEDRVCHAMDMLESLDRTPHVTALLLMHQSARVRAKALQVLSHGAPEAATRWEPTVEHLLRDDSAEVRAGAVEALATIHREDLPDLMRPYLADNDPRVVAAAAIVLSESDAPGDTEKAEAAIERLVGERTTLRRTALKEAARVVTRLPGSRPSRHLVDLIHDPDWEVAAEAIRQASTRRDGAHTLVPELVSLLPDRRLRHVARRALAGYGENVVTPLASSLNDRTSDPRVRWQVASTLPLVPCQQSVQALLDVLADPDPTLRYRAALALGKLRRKMDGLTFEQNVVEDAVVRTSERCYARLKQLAVVHHRPAVTGSLLGRVLREEIALEQRHLFELLSLIHPWREVRAVHWAIAKGSQSRRASAVEYLDNVMSRRVRQHAMLVLDRLPIDDQGRGLDALGTAATAEDVESTLSSLVRDHYPVVSLCAIDVVHTSNLTSLAQVLEQLLIDSSQDARLVESVRHVLTGLQNARHVTRPVDNPSTLQVVKKLFSVPALRFVPVKELFRLADAVEYVRYPSGQTLFREGDRADRVELVFEGDLVMRRRGAEVSRRGAGTLIGLEKLLVGRPMDEAASTQSPTVCVSWRADGFLALLSEHDNVTEGLFRFYLDRDGHPFVPIARGLLAPPAPASRGTVQNEISRSLSVAQKALLLERTTIFSGTRSDTLLHLAAVASEISLRREDVLCNASDPPSIYIVLDGELSVALPDDPRPLSVRCGDGLGIASTLVGQEMKLTTQATSDAVALQIQREDLFEVLGDHMDLLHLFFSRLLRDGPPTFYGRSRVQAYGHVTG